MGAPNWPILPEWQRSAILDQHLVTLCGHGARILTRTATSASVVIGRPINHVLHLLLSVFCCGWWLPVWLMLAAFSGERHRTVSVDPHGAVTGRDEPMSVHRVLLIAGAVVAGIVLLILFSSCAAAVVGDNSR